ncbi:MAG: 2-amino-4-hydroxy-6-hydroxymethyldihydropteridine diphosphokinase [Rikenellaceae bacterium]
MAELVLITGGNLGDVETTLKKCNSLIESRIGDVIVSSELKATPAWGFESEDEFLNQVLVINTLHSPESVLEILQAIERELGRDKNTTQVSELGVKRNYLSRVIDIDILFYDELILDTPTLKIPHVMMQERDFVLNPLSEVCADKVHPVYKKTISELRDELLKRNLD